MSEKTGEAVTCKQCKFWAQRDKYFDQSNGNCERIHSGGGYRNVDARLENGGVLATKPTFGCSLAERYRHD